MEPWMIVLAFVLYFLMLLGVGWLTGRNATKDSYFLGNRQSIWWLVAFGMLSDSMSGVSFISVPGDVYNSNFFYMQTVMGYVLGYVVIAFVLLPLYYKLQLTSIYSYLGQRFEKDHQRTGAAYFVLSRLVGSAARLCLTAVILQKYLFDAMGFPFWASVAIIIILILTYTIKGGIRTLVFTDAIQSAFLVGGLVLCVWALLKGLPGKDIFQWVQTSGHSNWFNWDFGSKTYFWKHFLGGAFICITMTGMDQNMMQKNLSCRSLKDAQKNILSYGSVVFIVNMIFLSLGALMLQYLFQHHIPMPLKPDGTADTDAIFPLLVLGKHLGLAAAVAFILGLAAATFSSADSVLTTLTTSTYIDFLHLDNSSKFNEKQKKNIRNFLHIGFAFLLLGLILFIRALNNDSLITTVLMVAGFTYGPLLGLFAFGILTKMKPGGTGAIVVCLVAPFYTFLISKIPPSAIGGYKFGFELLLINGMLTFIGLTLVSILGSRKKAVN
ncbi:MAG: sodium:solute symporter [Bacteroidetes bacterium]|nr:sodium:solute symporter [Bacteroidota bacterium]